MVVFPVIRGPIKILGFQIFQEICQKKGKSQWNIWEKCYCKINELKMSVKEGVTWGEFIIVNFTHVLHDISVK